jgi:hypothetical protein
LLATTDPVPGSGSTYGAVNALWAVRGQRPPSPYAPTVSATPGLVSYWRLDELSSLSNAADSHGSNYGRYLDNGIVTGSPFTFGVAGALLGTSSPAVQFNKGTSYNNSVTGDTIQAPAPGQPEASDLAFGDYFSAEFWVARAPAPHGDWGGPVIAFGNRVEIRIEDWSSLKVTMSDPSWSTANGIVAESDIPLGDHGFHHVVATKSGAESRIYIDGVNHTGVTRERSLTPGFGYIEIGGKGFADSCLCYAAGTMDEIAVYSRALTAAEVSQHYAAAKRTGRL